MTDSAFDATFRNFSTLSLSCGDEKSIARVYSMPGGEYRIGDIEAYIVEDGVEIFQGFLTGRKAILVRDIFEERLSAALAA